MASNFAASTSNADEPLNDLSCNSLISSVENVSRLTEGENITKNNITAVSEWDWHKELQNIASQEHYQCYMCGGYYGSNHSQPICTTCHMFLFPLPNLDDDDDIAESHRARNTTKDESEDSGTEEPLDLDDEMVEFLGGANHSVVHRSIGNIIFIDCEQSCSSGHAETAQVTSGNIKSDQLRQRVKELTEYGGDVGPAAMGSLAQDLPPEVLLQVFNNLSDMGLYTVSNVCNKWYELIDAEISNEQWAKHVKRRWPLFKPHFRVDSWKDIHSQLVSSAPCLYCIENMKLMSTPPICEKSWRHRRLTSELKSLQNDPPEGILAAPLDKKCTFWQAMITGPKGSPYEGGKFYLYLQIPHSYPLRPPFVQFITKIFHPNVSRHGDIGLDSIHHNWSLALTISKILLSIQSLLTDPYLKVCMEPAIARCYQDDIRLYNSLARRWTWKYAMTEKQQVYLGVIDSADGFIPFSNQAL